MTHEYEYASIDSDNDSASSPLSSTVFALPDLDDMTIRVRHVAANLETAR